MKSRLTCFILSLLLLANTACSGTTTEKGLAGKPDPSVKPGQPPPPPPLKRPPGPPPK